MTEPAKSHIDSLALVECPHCAGKLYLQVSTTAALHAPEWDESWNVRIPTPDD